MKHFVKDKTSKSLWFICVYVNYWYSHTMLSGTLRSDFLENTRERTALCPRKRRLPRFKCTFYGKWLRPIIRGDSSTENSNLCSTAGWLPVRCINNTVDPR